MKRLRIWSMCGLVAMGLLNFSLARAQDEPAPAAETPAADAAADAVQKAAEAATEPAKEGGDAPATDTAVKDAAVKDAATDKIKVKVEQLLTGLDNPCGVAVQPVTGDVFVAESAAGKIVRLAAGASGTAEDVITGFPIGEYGKGPVYKIGPLGLTFIDKDTLIVGGGGLEDGKELVYVYAVPERGKSIKAEETKLTLGPIGPGEASKDGEENFYALAIAAGNLYVTSNGDDNKGWLLKGTVSGDKPELTTYIATKEATQVDAPVGLAINRKGHIVVGQMGEINVAKDSLLTFYSPRSNKLLLNLKTDLFDIAGLAYSSSPNPDLQNLYAVDFAWMDTAQGGLFRIDGTQDDGGKIGCRAVLIEKLDKPTALVFGPDGKTLYVTVLGTAAEGSDKKPGMLLKIVGDGADL